MSTIPSFPASYDPKNPPACNMTFVDEFSAGVWDWIHGLIEFAIRDHDFSLDGFTMSDQPYKRHLDLMAAAEDDEERRALLVRPADCKSCQYLGCYAWCSPRFCRLCQADDDNRRRTLRSSSHMKSDASVRKGRHLQYNSTDYDLLGLKISEIVTSEAREYLQNYGEAEYACMGTASALGIAVWFIPYQ